MNFSSTPAVLSNCVKNFYAFAKNSSNNRLAHVTNIFFAAVPTIYAACSGLKWCVSWLKETPSDLLSDAEKAYIRIQIAEGNIRDAFDKLIGKNDVELWTRLIVNLPEKFGEVIEGAPLSLRAELYFTLAHTKLKEQEINEQLPEIEKGLQALVQASNADTVSKPSSKINTLFHWTKQYQHFCYSYKQELTNIIEALQDATTTDDDKKIPLIRLRQITNQLIRTSASKKQILQKLSNYCTDKANADWYKAFSIREEKKEETLSILLKTIDNDNILATNPPDDWQTVFNTLSENHSFSPKTPTIDVAQMWPDITAVIDKMIAIVEAIPKHQFEEQCKACRIILRQVASLNNCTIDLKQLPISLLIEKMDFSDFFFRLLVAAIPNQELPKYLDTLDKKAEEYLSKQPKNPHDLKNKIENVCLTFPPLFFVDDFKQLSNNPFFTQLSERSKISTYQTISKACAKKDLETAKHFLNLSLELIEKLPNTSRIIQAPKSSSSSSILSSSSTSASCMPIFDETKLELLEKTYRIANERKYKEIKKKALKSIHNIVTDSKDVDQQLEAYATMANIYSNKNKSTKAENSLNSGIELLKEKEFQFFELPLANQTALLTLFAENAKKLPENKFVEHIGNISRKTAAQFNIGFQKNLKSHNKFEIKNMIRLYIQLDHLITDCHIAKTIILPSLFDVKKHTMSPKMLLEMVAFTVQQFKKNVSPDFLESIFSLAVKNEEHLKLQTFEGIKDFIDILKQCHIFNDQSVCINFDIGSDLIKNLKRLPPQPSREQVDELKANIMAMMKTKKIKATLKTEIEEAIHNQSVKSLVLFFNLATELKIDLGSSEEPLAPYEKCATFITTTVTNPEDKALLYKSFIPFYLQVEAGIQQKDMNTKFLNNLTDFLTAFKNAILSLPYGSQMKTYLTSFLTLSCQQAFKLDPEKIKAAIAECDHSTRMQALKTKIVNWGALWLAARVFISSATFLKNKIYKLT